MKRPSRSEPLPLEHQFHERLLAAVEEADWTVSAELEIRSVSPKDLAEYESNFSLFG